MDVRPAATDLWRQAPARPRRRLLGELPAVHVHVVPPRVCRGLRIVRHWAPAATHPRLRASLRARARRLQRRAVRRTTLRPRGCIQLYPFVRSAFGPSWHWAGTATGPARHWAGIGLALGRQPHWHWAAPRCLVRRRYIDGHWEVATAVMKQVRSSLRRSRASRAALRCLRACVHVVCVNRKLAR